jgi:hypothetical protein
MKNPTSLAVLIAGALLASSSTAAAQATTPTSVFIDINGGAQTQSRTLTTSSSFPLYGETAVVNAAGAVDGGGLFDISGGYQVTPRLGVAVGFSIFSKSGDGSLVASIPDPIFVNRPAVKTTDATDLKHRETATHLMAVYPVPLHIMDKVETRISGGVSFFRLSQDIMSATVPPGTQTANVATTEESGNATGGNVGVNINYMYKPNYGGGIFLRYAGASVELPSAGKVRVGGFQLGAGARLRF